MRAPGTRSLLIYAAFLLAGAPARGQKGSTKPQVISKMQNPLRFTERPSASLNEPGKSQIAFAWPASDWDLESQIWKVGDSYNLESKIDVRKANQAILPTDNYGRLTKEAKALTGRPFIKYFLPDGTQKIIDVQCTKKQCRGLWKNFPYRADIPTRYRVEVNIRGLQGQSWQISFNQVTPEKDLVQLKPEILAAEAPHRFSRSRLYQKGNYVPPGVGGAREPDFIEEWNFEPTQKNNAVAPHRLGRLTLYEILDGPLILEVERANDGTLESIEINTGDRVWLPAESIVGIKAPSGGRLRRLEFSL